MLLYEHARQPPSPWKAYLDILPSHFNTLMFWSEAELAELQASDVRNKIGKATADTVFQTKLLPIVRGNPDLFSFTGRVPSDSVLLSLAHRMGSTVMSYAFDLDKDTAANPDEDGYETEDEEYALRPKAMVPLADMLNSDAEFNAHLFQGPTSVTMKSLRPIAQGEEILNDYGPLPRADLLRRYGYVSPKYARYDVVELPQKDLVDICIRESGQTLDQLVTKTDSVTDGAIDLAVTDEVFLLERENEDTDDTGINTSTPTLSLPEDAVMLVKILLASNDEAARLKKLAPERKAELDQQCGRVFQQLLEAKLAAYGTTAAQDATLLQDSSLASRHRMAVEVRLGEKELLGEALELARGMQHSSNGHSSDRPTKRQRVG